jgi:hypothetical protein
MTVGTIYTPASSPNTNYWSYRNWSGADGKYLVDGRDKWNAYSLYHLTESDQFGQTVYPASTVSGPYYSWTSQDEMRLQSKLVKKVKGSDFNLAVNLAQGHQVVNMCASTLRHLGRSLSRLKHGDISGAFRELGVTGTGRPLKSKDVSGRWLEMQYGWIPLVSDCYGAAKAFESLSEGRKNRIVVTEKVVRPVNLSASPGSYESKGNTTIIKRIVYEMEEELSFGRTLGLADPLSVVWEILPYSFVIDWFLPVGTYLQNLNVIPSLKGRFLTTQFQKTETRFTAALSPPWVGTRRQGHIIELTRTPSLGLSTQRPSFVHPFDALTTKRIANAVSLCHQAFVEDRLDRALKLLDIPF